MIILQGATLVTVFICTTNVLVPQQASTAPVGGVKTHGEPNVTVRFGGQVTTGGVVSITVTVWLHVAKLVQQSIACQVRVTELEQKLEAPLVTVLRTVTITLVPQHASIAVGGLNDHVEPHCTILFDAQISTGGVVSVIMMVCAHVAELLQQSVACHVLVTK